jgi:CRP/FNR family nitrogen fixation transcriptional regulator
MSSFRVYPYEVWPVTVYGNEPLLLPEDCVGDFCPARAFLPAWLLLPSNQRNPSMNLANGTEQRQRGGSRCSKAGTHAGPAVMSASPQAFDEVGDTFPDGSGGRPLDVFGLLEAFGSTVTIRRHCEIYGHGQPTDYCWRVITGCARTVMLMGDGRRHVGEFLLPGDLLGMHDLELHDSDAQAVTDMTLRRYPRRVVEERANGDAAFAFYLRLLAMGTLRCANRQITLLGRKTAMERIASFLLEMGRRPAAVEGKFVELPMSRSDIADHLGLSIETVCRSLVRLQHGGAVVIARSGIELRDRAALFKLASCL